MIVDSSPLCNVGSLFLLSLFPACSSYYANILLNVPTAIDGINLRFKNVNCKHDKKKDPRNLLALIVLAILLAKLANPNAD